MTKKSGNVLLYTLLGFPLLVFLLFPAEASDGWTMSLNDFLDAHLFGNGYYKPDRYPFAAKVTNSLTVVFAVLIGIFAGIIRRNETDDLSPKDRKKAYIFIIVMMIFLLGVSIYPQEFSTSPGRNFGLTRSFHNNYFFFLFLMTAKEIMIFGGVAILIRLVYRAFKILRE